MEPLSDEKLRALAEYTEQRLGEARSKGSTSVSYLADVFTALLELLDARKLRKEEAL